MYASSNNKDDTNLRQNFNSTCEHDESNFYNRSNMTPPNMEIDEASDSGAYHQSHESHFNTTNDVSRSTNEYTSPYEVNNSWKYEAILNDRGYPRIRISNTGNSKKSRTKKSRVDFPLYQNNDFSSTVVTSQKMHSKLESSKKSTRKKSFKRRKKLPVSPVNNSFNGLSSANCITTDDSNYQNDLVPTQPNTDTDLEASISGKQNHYISSREEAEYAPQYLELKPSVKFKCCRCGTNDFSTMALLQEHMALCDGHPSASATANSLLELSSSYCESRQPYVARNLKIKRKVLLCSSCGTYYQHYNLYVHMRDTHNKEICLFCRSTFSEAQQLWDHLIVAHSLSTMKYSNAAQVRDSFKNFFITCCSCNTIFSDQDEFGEHKCNSTADSTQEKSHDISFKSTNELLSQDDSEKLTQVPDRDFSLNNEDETAANVPEIDEEHATVESSSNAIETPEMENFDQTPAPDAQIDEDPVHSESFISENNEKEAANDDNEFDQQPMLERPDSEVNNSPFPSSTDEIRENVDDSENVPADPHTGQESVPNLILPESCEFPSEPVPCMDECSEPERKLSTESVNAENTSATKNEENNSNWLESDDEMENLVPVAQNEVAPQNVDVVEPPQPLAMALMLDEAVLTLSVQTLIKECVRTSCDTCLYCNNAILITVNGGQLAAHLRSEHRYMPTKPEDSPEHVIQKIEEAMNDLKFVFMNASLSTAYTQFDGTFACLQCSYSTTLFKELCHHKRKVHHKVIFLCIMCKCNFFYYSQLLCHLCPGLYSPETQNTLNYHCCFCNQDGIPSAFRLMVHLRKIHQACDICLTQYKNQSELFSHMIKQHKMNHLCYKCNLAYRSRDGINEHLYWKHGTESVLCKRCLQKKWPHAYHFCIPASTYTCEECSRIFTKAVALTVHRRAHNGDFPSACTHCEQKFISKKLLTVHERDMHGIQPEPSETEAKKEEAENEPTPEGKEANSAKDDDGKKRRKRKRKKEGIDAEKPLLDELPPLNLSSESEEDSDEDETRKSSVAESLPPTQEQPTSAVDEIESKIDSTKPTDSAAAEVPPDSSSAPEALPAEVAETESSRADDVEKLPGTDDTVDVEPSKDKVDSTSVEISAEQNPSEGEPNPADERNEAPETVVPIDVANATTTSVEADVAESSTITEEGVAALPQPSPEVSIERIRNCLLIEHSYCIPDSIFYSEGAAEADNSLETIAEKLSPKVCAKTRDRLSSCKSVTPRKRKRPSKRDSSSSESSSDSDTSSSSCGSNCSCNQKSNSNCSSSSSGSDCSTTPDKKNSKGSRNESRKDASAASEKKKMKDERDSLLNARESDLDTDIQTSDEDFYDRYPNSVAGVEEKSELPPLPITTMPPTQPTPSLPKKQPSSSSSRKVRKRRRAPKIKISLGPQNNGTCVATSISVDSPQFDIPTYRPAALNDNSHPGINLCRTDPTSSYTSIPNSISNDAHVRVNSFGAGGDDSDRRSKRERVKNKFYGYSSSDECGNNESTKPLSIKKRPASKRPPKVVIKQPFVGIRVKKPAIMTPKRPSQSTSSMVVARPSLPYRMPNYIMQQQQQQQQQLQQLQHLHRQQQQQQQYQHQRQYQQSSSSSDDSDSDNLVINEPTLNDRSVSNRPSFRFPIYPPAEPSNWQRGVESTAAGLARPKNEKLYCYCRCPYDEVSEMIGCDGANCKYEWFHFECVGIMVPPKGAWYCSQCKNREAVPQFM